MPLTIDIDTTVRGAAPCAPGTGGAACTPCAPGTWSPGGNLSVLAPECIQCPWDYTSLVPGASKAADCNGAGVAHTRGALRNAYAAETSTQHSNHPAPRCMHGGNMR